MQIPELVNLNDSNTSFTDFLNKIPEEIDEPFDDKLQNGLILQEIINKIVRNPVKSEEVKVYINDTGYEQIQEIQSVLGVTLKIDKDVEEVLQDSTRAVMAQFESELPQEIESQSEAIVNVQQMEYEETKKLCQQEIIDLNLNLSKLHRDDIRCELTKQLIKQKEVCIKLSQKCINLLSDQFMFRKCRHQLVQFIEQLVYGTLKLEATLSFRTQRLNLELKMNQNERELAQSQQIARLKQQLYTKDQQLQEIQNQIQFSVFHYTHLEEQIASSKQFIQKQLQALRKQKDELEKQKNQTSSPSQSQMRDTSKSIISDAEVMKKQIIATQKKKSSNTNDAPPQSGQSYATRARYKTIFFKRQ